MHIESLHISLKMPRVYLVLFLLLIGQICWSQVTLSGKISNPEGTPIENVLVHTIFGVPIYTDVNGNYEFTVPEGASVVISPSSNADLRNGVSTLDMVAIQNHLIGTQLLDNPYKIIAADVNNSGQVNTFDLIDLEKVILHQIDEFPNNTSWRFINADFFFPDETNPFVSVFPEDYSINSAANEVINFIGVKVGDVTCSANTKLEIDPCDLACGKISGSILYDREGDCIISGDEQALKNWVVKLDDGTIVQYTVTGQNGGYSFNVPPGDYTISTTPINTLWTLCQESYAATLDFGQDLNIDFKANAVEECHFLSVNIGTQFLRRCFDNNYHVHYCNTGTAPADDASIDITFDPLISVESSNLPWSNQNGDTYTFELGDLDVDACAVFNIKTLVSCEAELGQTLCNEAQIFPETNCADPPNWDGSNLEVTASCQDEEVEFEITNIGDAMLTAQDYIVIEDDMIMMMDQSGSIQLGALESSVISLPANGATWRVEVNQSVDHPFSQMISAVIEGCGEDVNGNATQGLINAFPQYTSSPAIDVDCEEVIGSWDPNDKAAKPTGAQEENYIEANTPIEYTIRFQNTGTDTAFTVKILDQLSLDLDIQTVRPGPSSHDYVFKINGENELEFHFPMISLPDSAANLAGSNGFVKFSVAQKTDLPIGTIIENNAGIYFDFNEPVITNTVFHTIGEDFLDVISNTTIPKYQHVKVEVSPNPMQHSTTVTLGGINLKTADFILYDLQGQVVRNLIFNGNSLIVHKSELSAGAYLFKVQENGTLISSGKIIMR